METSRPTTHSEPVYLVDEVLHYCVTNMPGAVGRTSTYALCNVTLPWALQIANRGLTAAARVVAADGPGDQHHRSRSDQSGRGRNLFACPTAGGLHDEPTVSKSARALASCRARLTRDAPTADAASQTLRWHRRR